MKKFLSLVAAVCLMSGMANAETVLLDVAPGNTSDGSGSLQANGYTVSWKSFGGSSTSNRAEAEGLVFYKITSDNGYVQIEAPTDFKAGQELVVKCYNTKTSAKNGIGFKLNDGAATLTGDFGATEVKDLVYTFDGSEGNTIKIGRIDSNAPFINSLKIVEQGYTVYYGNSGTNWDTVYAYVWNGDQNNTWPGTEMTNTGVNGIWSVSLDVDFTPTNIIFSNGDGAQTDDLEFVNGQTYGAQPAEYTIKFDAEQNGWSKVYVYAWNASGELAGTFPGTLMVMDGTVGTYTITALAAPDGFVFSNGVSDKTADVAYEEGTEVYSAPSMFADWWVNAPGAYNEWADYGAQPVQGIATIEFAEGVAGEFKIKIWNGTEGIYHANGETLPVGQWVAIPDNGDNMTFPAECESAKTILTYNCLTNEIYLDVPATAVVPVTGNTTWDWANCTTSTSDIKPVKDEDVFFANYGPWNESFNAAALEAVGEYLYRASYKCFQGQWVMFETTIPGTVTVTFSGTNKTERYLAINGEKTDYMYNSTDDVTSGAIAVAAGQVKIGGMEGDAPAYLRIKKIVFQGNTTGIEGVNAADNAPVEYFNLQGVRVQNPANGLFIKRQGSKVEKVLVK